MQTLTASEIGTLTSAERKLIIAVVNGYMQPPTAIDNTNLQFVTRHAINAALTKAASNLTAVGMQTATSIRKKLNIQ